MTMGDSGDRPAGFGPVAWLYRTLNVASGVMVAAMMFITTVDVAGRYLFDRPLYAAFEVTEILMGMVIFAALPLATAARENIEISILTERLPAGVRQWQARVMEVACGVICLVMSWRIWASGERFWRTGDRTLELQVSIGLLAQIMACLLALTGIAFLANALYGRRTLPPSTNTIE